MKKCKFCGKELDDKDLFCISCGRQCEDLPEDGPVCPRCGRQNKEGDLFCRGCGEKLKETEGAESSEQSHSTKGKRNLFIPAIAGGIFAVAVAVGGILLAFKGMKKGEDADAVAATMDSQQEVLQKDTPSFDLSQAKLVENYRKPEGTGTIDLSARNHQPGARDTSALWDKDLFYRLEDIGGEDDNHIADCFLMRMELVRTDNGKTMEYEVYRDKETGQIVKIVSIEVLEDKSLELSDYYYQDGKPNFVFRRSDSIYTPSYATIDKTGERYYFSGDQMVKWRWIYEPLVVKQWILEPEETWYTQWGYMEISDGERDQYDEKEFQVLNEAYNTYEAVLANEPAELIQGRVTDEEGQPLEAVEVGIGRMEGGEAKAPEVKVETDQEGIYAWEIPEGEEGEGYFLVFRKEGWVSSLMQVTVTGAGSLMMQAAQEDMVLLEEKEETAYPVIFYAYQVEVQEEEEVQARALAQGEKEEALPALEGASIKVYGGINWLLGSPAAEGETSGAGSLSMELPAGIYTAVIEKEGVVPSRKVFLAGGQEKRQTIYAMRKGNKEAAGDREEGSGESAGNGAGENAEGWSILLSWDSSDTEPLDLDSSLFTPDKAAKGDRNCINTLNRKDYAGARFLYDGEGRNACELITLTWPKRGSYKYYVTDYTGIQEGAMDSERMAKSGAKVTVFHDGVPVKTFPVPDKAGTVWEVFELRDQGIVPIQEVYGSVEGKSWWLEDKKLARLSERSVRAKWIQSDGEWLYFSNPADEGRVYYCRKDGSGLTKISEDRLADPRILLAEDQIYYVTYNEGGAPYDYMSQNIVRIKNDGSQRTVIQENIQQEEIELSAGIFLTGYANGMIHYLNSSVTSQRSSVVSADGEPLDPSIWSVSASDANGNIPHGYYEGDLQMPVVVGNYLYFLDQVDYGYYSFCRKDLESGEEEWLVSPVSWHPWSWRIYKGYVYFTVHGDIKRTKLVGPGSLIQQELLADNGADCEELFGLHTENTYYFLEFLGDTCYYLGNDNLLHAMNLDGSGQRVLPFTGDRAVPIDGELYGVDSGSRLPSVIAGDKNGENQRNLFDAVSIWDDQAGKAYAQFLESYVPEAFDFDLPDVNQGPFFACQDLDGDGVKELLLQYASYSNFFFDYYRYDEWGIKTVWSGKLGVVETAVDRDAQEILMDVKLSDWDRNIERYGMDGTLVEKMEFSFAMDDPLETDAYSNAYKTCIESNPGLNFVENTPENRQKYLLGGMETGWVSR